MFARLVHDESDRSAAPFVALNCGAITRELFGSEIFGHVGGAFTGSSKEGKAGVFELANGGVLSLDEIGEMPLDIQPFLLRVLEERVGAAHRRHARPARRRAADRFNQSRSLARKSRQDVSAAISSIASASCRFTCRPYASAGTTFRCLIRHYNEKAARQTGRAVTRIHRDAIEALKAYRWPGNVRELRTSCRASTFCRRRRSFATRTCRRNVRSAEPVRVRSRDARKGNGERGAGLEDAERAAVMEALAAERGNLSKVAQRLGISRPTLYRKIYLYGIQTQRKFS